MNNAFGIRLKALRTERKETQEDIAKLLNVGRSIIPSYENGNVLPPISKIQILADHFCVSLDYLTGVSNNQINENEESTEDIALILDKICRKLKSKNTICRWNSKPIDSQKAEFLRKQLENIVEIINFIN